MSKCKYGHDCGRYPNGTCKECSAVRAARYHLANRSSIIARKRNAYESNAGGYRDRTLSATRKSWRRRNGVPEPTRPAPVICECCGRPPRKMGLAVDHDHETGEFRGWLCGPCNTAIGSLGDTIDAVKRAVAYLERAGG